jgi:hypothetical protein
MATFVYKKRRTNFRLRSKKTRHVFVEKMKIPRENTKTMPKRREPFFNLASKFHSLFGQFVICERLKTRRRIRHSVDSNYAMLFIAAK